MNLTNKQKTIKERREYVYSAYVDNNVNKATGDVSRFVPVSVLVGNLARKFKITEVQIYNDIKIAKSQNNE